MAVLLVGIYSEGSVWLVREVRWVLRLLGVGSKTKNWADYNSIGTVGGMTTFGCFMKKDGSSDWDCW